MILYQCTLNGATAGVVTDNSGIITQVAPFYKWAKGFPMQTLIGWLAKKGGSYIKVSEFEES